MEKLGVLIAAGLALALVLVIVDERFDLTRRFRRWRRQARRGKR